MKKILLGVNSTQKTFKAGYVGIGGAVKNITEIYIGADNAVKKVWPEFNLVKGLYLFTVNGAPYYATDITKTSTYNKINITWKSTNAKKVIIYKNYYIIVEYISNSNIWIHYSTDCINWLQINTGIVTSSVPDISIINNKLYILYKSTSPAYSYLTTEDLINFTIYTYTDADEDVISEYRFFPAYNNIITKYTANVSSDGYRYDLGLKLSTDGGVTWEKKSSAGYVDYVYGSGISPSNNNLVWEFRDQYIITNHFHFVALNNSGTYTSSEWSVCKLLDSSLKLVKNLYNATGGSNSNTNYYLHPVSKNTLVTEVYTISSNSYAEYYVSAVYLATNVLEATFNKTGKLIKKYDKTTITYPFTGVYNKDQQATFIIGSFKKNDGNYYLDMWKVNDSDLNNFTTVLTEEQNNTFYNISNIYYMSN